MTGVIGRKGGKGGGSQGSSASEAPNTLQSRATARLVEIISHGECFGLADRDYPLRSVKFDGVPAQNSDGTNNFSGLTVQERAGLPDQDPFVGFAESESEFGQGLPITVLNPRTYAVTNNFVSAVRVRIQIDSLSSQDKENGGIKGSSVSYSIATRLAGGAWTTVIVEDLAEKSTSPQQLSYRVERPAGAGDTGDWEVRVTRLTPDSTEVTVQNSISLSAITELVDSNLEYADYAAVALEIDSEQFGGAIPTRSYDFVGMILDVPSNYTPPHYSDPNDITKRTYTGLWDGTFKRAWTDNPAWILWAMLTNKEWGLGRVIQAGQVDKWSLYQIAQYCDAFVDDGYGGREPRYAINTQITSSEEAYAMLQSIASAFRGMLYWGSGSVTFVADQPRDAVKLVSPANVINGEFVYQGSALKSRHSVARITWNDPSDRFKPAVEVVEDAEMISRFGWRTVDVVAYGCTSRGQANRMGRWILDTERYESEVVSYEASFDHADLRPGDIIEVRDPNYAGARMSGRSVAVTNSSLTIDAPFTIQSGQVYTLTVPRPDGTLIDRTLTNSPGTTSVLTWSSSAPLGQLPQGGSTASIFSDAEMYSTQRASVLGSTGTSVTLISEITKLAGVRYELNYTDAGGTFRSVLLPIELNDTSLKVVTWTGSVTPPPINSVIFIVPDGEGFVSRTIGAVGANSCSINTPITILVGQDYLVEFVLPDGTRTTRKLTNNPGATSTLTWSDALNALPPVGGLWGLRSNSLNPRLFRVMGLKETEKNIFGVSALAYDPNKYARVEEGLLLPPSTTSQYELDRIPLPPTNLQAYRRPVLQSNGTFLENIVAFWTPSTSSFVARYRVSLKYENESWANLGDVTSPTIEFRSQGIGVYSFRIIAVTFSGKESPALQVSLAVTESRPLAESIITNVRIENSLDEVQPSPVEFYGRDLAIVWNLLPPADWVNADPEHWDDPYFRRYRIRVRDEFDNIRATYYTTDRRFFFSYDQNVEAGGGEAMREFTVGVSLEDTLNNTYPEVLQTFYNPPPLLSAAPVEIIPGETEISFRFDEPNVSDYAGIIVWMSDLSPVDPIDANKVWFGRGAPVIPCEREHQYFIRYAFYDTFGITDLDLSANILIESLQLLIDGMTPEEWLQEVIDLSLIGEELAALADQLTTDTVNNSMAILEGFNRLVEDRGYLEDLTYEEGVPLKTVVKNEVSERIEGDEAIVEKLSLIGVVSVDGLSFILDVDTVKINPTESLADRFNMIQSTFGDVEATIAQEATTRATADTATAETISLLGAKNLSGTAFILDQNTTMVSPTESLSQRLTAISSSMGANTAAISAEATTRATADSAISSTIALIGAKNAGGTAFIMDTNKTLVSPTESFATRLTNISSTLGSHTASLTTLASADAVLGTKWGISMNVNGHITGVILNNNGNAGNAVFVVNNFAVVNPAGSVSTAPFAVIGTDVHMTNVIVHSLAANIITTNKIVANNITETSVASDSSNTTLGLGSNTYMVGVNQYIYGRAVDVNMFLNISNNTGDSTCVFGIYRDGNLIDAASLFCRGAWGNNYTFYPATDWPGAGNHSYTVYAYNNYYNNTTLVKTRAWIRVQERKTES